MTQHEALIVVDVQNDFCEGGALAVPQGSEVVEPINAMMPDFATVVFSQDWHPGGHLSFASSHPGKAPYEMVTLPYGEQVLWPDHCVQGAHGAEFHPRLQQDTAHLILRKGFRPKIDSYSAFFENDRETSTGLDGYLRSRGVTAITLVGLALDFCVAYSAIDGARLGYDTRVITQACRAIDLNGSLAQANHNMTKAGVEIL